MNPRRILIVLAILIPVVAGVWFLATPSKATQLPDVPMEGADPAVIKLVEQAKERVRLKPESGKAWGELALVLLGNGFDRQALPCLAEAQRLEPDVASWPFHQGAVSIIFFNPLDGIPKLEEALKLTRNPADRGGILLLMALTDAENGQLERAEQTLKRLEDLEPGSPRIHCGYGVLALVRGDRKTAREHYIQLTEDPHARKAACKFLATFTEDGAAAEKYRLLAASLPPDQVWPISYYDEVIPYRHSSGANLAPFYELKAAGRMSEAIERLYSIVFQTPSEKACFILAMTLAEAHRPAEAVPIFRQTIQLNPRNARASLFLGLALLELGEHSLRELGQTSRALDYFKEAAQAEGECIRLQQDLALSHLTRGRALAYLGREDEALKSFQKAALIGPDLPEAHLALGEALAEAGRFQEALKCFQDAASVAKPNDRRPADVIAKWKLASKPIPVVPKK